MTYIPFNQLQTIVIDFTAYCNSMCGNCSRNLGGTTLNPLMPLEHMSLDSWKKLMDKETVEQINEIIFNGSYGDSPMNPNLIPALEYLISLTDNLPIIRIDTNSGMNNTDWWRRLARCLSKFPKPTHVTFSIDGLEDTNHLYRRGVSWKKVMENSKAFIDEGGWARWRTLIFQHNKHQIDDMKSLSEDLGFLKFDINGGHANSAIQSVISDAKERFKANKKQSSYEIEYAFLEHEIRIKKLIESYETLENAFINIPIECKWQRKKKVQVSHMGEVWPCCYFLSDRYPRNPDNIFAKDIKRILEENEKNFNNINSHTLKEILNHEWFVKTLTNSWDSIDRYEICPRSCGK